MNKSIAAWSGTFAALALAGSLRAHHSISMFEIAKPIWVKGTVVRYEAANPHVIIVIEEAMDDGTDRRWLVEGPALHRLERMNVGPDFIQTGDDIEICGFPPKPEFSSQRPSTAKAGYPPQTFHGHVLVLGEGQMRHWGPYGKIENCIRPDDQPQTWVNFLNTDPMARAAWCHSASLTWAASLPPKTFADEVSRLMAEPCD